jgi:hypothetical protein
MDHIAQEIVFKGNKPSKKQVYSKALKGAESGQTLIEIYWGENGITLDLNGSSWYGWGWIKDISGDDIAQALNRKQENKTLNLWNS